MSEDEPAATEKRKLSAQEQRRRWQERLVHVLDTPGYPDFIGSAIASLSAVETAVVAVCPGQGNRRLFESLGATRVIEGGQTMNPSAAELVVLEPTDLVDRTPQEMEIDGVRFVFQYTPDSEAPAELTLVALAGATLVSMVLVALKGL